MKIGVLTHHYVGNYGAVMQADALISTIQSLGSYIEVELIDYRIINHELRSNSRFFHYKDFDTPTSFLNKVKLYFTLRNFQKNLPTGKRVKNAEEIMKQKYDLIIVGSDEVWNYNDQAYSPIKFGEGISCPLITYAASVGGSTINDAIPESVKNGIKKFSAIGVRDEKTNELVLKLLKKNAVRTLDPVYLYDYQLIYRNKISQIIDQRPYILVYDCNLSSQHVEQLIKYAEKNGMNIIGAGEYRSWYSTADTVNITPYEWAYLFKNASIVVTGTFHGTSFAIKYNRLFVSYLTEQNRINKVRSLLREFNLENQIVSKKDDSLISTMQRKIDYSYVRSIIEVRRHQSIEYLSQSIITVRSN